MGRRKSTRSATAPGNWKGRQPGPSRFSALPLRAHPHRLLLRLAADRDLARLRHRHLGDLDYQDAVLEACLDLVLLDVAGQLDATREGAVGQLAT